MRCFYHEDREAVGICQSCGKSVCRKCAVDLIKGLACRGHCEADVRLLIRARNEHEKNLESYHDQSVQYEKHAKKFEKDNKVWEKTMSDYEKKYKPRQPPKK